MRARASAEFSPIPPEKTRMIEPSQRRRQGPDRFLRMVEEQCDGLGRPDVVILSRQQVAQIGAGLRDAQQARFVVDERVKLLGRRCPRIWARNQGRSGVDIAGARRHHQSRCRRQAHRGVDALPLVDRGHAGPRAQVRENHAAGSRLRAREALEFLHEIGVRQAVKPITPNAHGLEPPRNRHDLGDARHVMMKPRVEAGDLRHRGNSLWNRSIKAISAGRWSTSSGQIRRSSAMQLGGDRLRTMIPRPSVHDPMPHAGQTGDLVMFLEPVDEHLGGRPEIRGADRPALNDFPIGTRDDGPRIRSAQPARFDPRPLVRAHSLQTSCTGIART